MSGPAIKPVALAKVLSIKRKYPDIPIIGIGGIMNWKDVVEFLIVGASAVQLGTINFVQPNAAELIIPELEKYCSEFDIANIADLVGSFVV